MFFNKHLFPFQLNKPPHLCHSLTSTGIKHVYVTQTTKPDVNAATISRLTTSEFHFAFWHALICATARGTLPRGICQLPQIHTHFFSRG